MNETQLRILSYNIRFDSPADGVHAWPHRRSRVSDLLRFHRPDIIGLQEALLPQIEDIVGAMKGYEWIGEGRDGKNSGEFTPILYRTDRLAVVESQTRWLSDTPEVAGSIGWDADTPRTITSASLIHRQLGLRFLAHNLHFDHKGKEAVSNSVDLLVHWLSDQDGRIAPRCVVMGDFNFFPDSEEYRLVSSRLRDSRTSALELTYGPDTTYVGPGFLTSHKPGPRCDYVFVSPDVSVARHATLSDSWDGTHPSDHFPVLADVQMEASGE